MLFITVPNTFSYFQADKHIKNAQFWKRKKNISRAFKETSLAHKNNPKEHFYIQEKGSLLYAYARGQKDRKRMNDFVVKAEKVLNSGLKHSWAPENIYIAKINGRMMLKDYAGAARACDMTLKHSPHLDQIINLRNKLKQVRR